jgi:hypothetical protein
MPESPEGHKRPADAIGNAVRVMNLATGDADEAEIKTSREATGGPAGGRARSAKLCEAACRYTRLDPSENTMALFAESFVRQTGNLWKLAVGLGVAVVSTAMLIVSTTKSELNEFPTGSMLAWAGSAVCLFSVFQWIRCPSCKLRLLWWAARTGTAATWVAILFGLRACPRCGFKGGGIG